MSRHLILLLCSLPLLSSCGDTGATESADTPRSDTPGATYNATFQFLSFSRLEGLGGDVPCTPEEVESLLASAAILKRQHAEAGEQAFLVCIGDSVIQAPTVTNTQGSIAAARAKADAGLDAMAAAGVDFYVPSHGDFLEGPNDLLDRASARDIPILLTNVEIEGRDDIVPYRIVSQDGVRVACLGLIPPKAIHQVAVPRSADPIRIGNPVARARQVAERLVRDGEANMVVVFSSLTAETNQALCSIPAVHFVIGTFDFGLPADKIVQNSGTSLMYLRTSGRELARSTLKVVDGSLELLNVAPVHVLPGRIAEDEETIRSWEEAYGATDPNELASLVAPGFEDQFLSRYTRIQENRGFVEKARNHTGSSIDHHTVVDLPRPAADDPVVAALAAAGPAMRHAVAQLGESRLAPLDKDVRIPHPDECQSCHPSQYDFWAATDHARAFDDLVAMEHESDGSCLICHAVGYRARGGFDDPRHKGPYGGVTCFNCHIVQAPHVDTIRLVNEPAFASSKLATMDCSNCHTQRRSPGFDVDAALPLVSCPPMRPDDPILVEQHRRALRALERQEARGGSTPRDLYLKARALAGLSRIDEAIELIVEYGQSVKGNTNITLELAQYCEGLGRSNAALEVLREMLGRATGDYPLNLYYLELLLNASDPEARNPTLAASHAGLLLPDGVQIKSEYLEIHLLHVDALFAAGRRMEGLALLSRIGEQYSANEGVQQRIEQYMPH